MPRVKSSDPAAVLRAQKEKDRAQKFSQSVDILGEIVDGCTHLEAITRAAERIKEDRMDRQRLLQQIQKLQTQMRDSFMEKERLKAQLYGFQHYPTGWGFMPLQIPSPSGNMWSPAPWNLHQNGFPCFPGPMAGGMNPMGFDLSAVPQISLSRSLTLPENAVIQNSKGVSRPFDSSGTAVNPAHPNIVYDIPDPGDDVFEDIRTDDCTNSNMPQSGSPPENYPTPPLSGPNSPQEVQTPPRAVTPDSHPQDAEARKHGSTGGTPSVLQLPNDEDIWLTDSLTTVEQEAFRNFKNSDVAFNADELVRVLETHESTQESSSASSFEMDYCLVDLLNDPEFSLDL